LFKRLAGKNEGEPWMTRFKNAAEIFRLVDKSNCRKCGELTCLAFAGSVFLGKRKLHECPKLPSEIIEQFSRESDHRRTADPDPGIFLKKLQTEILSLDLSQAAQRVEAHFSGNKLTIKVLGKDFSIDKKGRLFSDIHINPWVVIPFLTYILHGEGLPVCGQWVSFRELTGGRAQYPLFQKRCEESIKQVADHYPDLFNDIIHLFSGQKVEPQFQSDISVVLLPLPRVPVMICYWLPEEGLGSSLNVFFDETASRNLDIGSVFMLGTGLAEMFRKIALTHGFSVMAPIAPAR
jgi:hypothetical protein